VRDLFCNEVCMGATPIGGSGRMLARITFWL